MTPDEMTQSLSHLTTVFPNRIVVSGAYLENLSNIDFTRQSLNKALILGGALSGKIDEIGPDLQEKYQKLFRKFKQNSCILRLIRLLVTYNFCQMILHDIEFS